MEIAKMDYKFTIILFIMITLLALFGGPAHSKNEYLNEYGVRCGDFEVTTERRDTDYNYNDNNTNEQDYLKFTYRKYLGTDCKTQKENVKLKQQLELMKMCGRVNGNPTLKLNPEFSLLVNKCRGIAPSGLDNRPNDANSHWDTLKNDYKKENPDVILMNDKFIGPQNETK
tara:strand:- start:637 stop:1149 length:513 start_codon:yes stop_codon:yes gene_type:complete